MLQLVKQIFGTKAPEQKSCTIEINERCLCLAEITEYGDFNLSFLFIGSYGNYLVGTPRDYETFDRIFYNRGGVKYGFPLSLCQQEARGFEALFKRYGLSLITEHTELNWQLPSLKASMAAINDLKFEVFSYAGLPGLRCESGGRALVFHDLIIGDGQSVSFAKSDTEPEEELDERSYTLENFHKRGDILIPSRFRGSAIDLAGCLAGECQVEQKPFAAFITDQSAKGLPSVSQMEKLERSGIELSITDITNKLVAGRFIFNHDEATNTIAFYDDVEFERNDFEVLSPISRMQLQTLLVEAGYKRCMGGIYSHQHAVRAPEFFILPPPRSLMSGLLDMFNARGHEQTVILTPTQQAALIIGSGRDDKNERLLVLAQSLPINRRKLIDFLRDSSIDMDESIKSEFASRQRAVTDKYRRLKPKGAKRKA